MRRVLVSENQRLLGAGIENLLRREHDLLVMGVALEGQEALRRAIDRSQPDVVVLDEATIDAAGLLELLEYYPRLRVVLVSADGSLVHTYKAQQVVVTQATELVDLVKS
jgi:DNA-binding NarL/FixJ family response regulator